MNKFSAYMKEYSAKKLLLLSRFVKLALLKISEFMHELFHIIEKFIYIAVRILRIIIFCIFIIIMIIWVSFILCNAIYSMKITHTIKLESLNSFIYFDCTGYPSIYASIIALAALSSPAVAYYWSMRQNERNQINLSYDFLKEWRENKVPSAMYDLHYYFQEKEFDAARTIEFLLTDYQ